MQGTQAVVAVTAAVLLSSAYPSAGQEARAAATRSERANNLGPSPDSILGGLSFTSRREPISVSADTLEFDYRKRVLIYKGSVIVTQGEMKLEANRLTVSLEDVNESRIKEVVAEGQVRISQGARWATGGR